MYKPFMEQLDNTFINRRGEISNNLQSSKSKVAKQIRQEREEKERASAFLKESKEMRKEITYSRKKVVSLRKAGMRLSGSARTEMFQAAASYERRVRELQALISELKRRHEVK